MSNTFWLVIKLWRQLGPAWLAFRLIYAAQMRFGLLRRRMPAYTWAERPLAMWLRPDVPSDPEAYFEWRRRHGGRFFFDDAREVLHAAPWDTASVVAEADAILAGEWRYFSHMALTVDFPPDWHANPLTGQRLPPNAHWTQIGDFSHGDIKLIWEASRFGVAYTLVRAYAATGDERYPEAFWQLVEDWAEHNPPNTGLNWKCGQEATFRLMAWCFGLFGFARSCHTTPARAASMVAMLATHAERVERNIAYARSQKNNHAISEAVGLWTAGLLFPELVHADRWRERGRQIIELELGRQVYPDGAYVQHSNFYHRVMLHDCLWALRLGELNDYRLSDSSYQQVDRAVHFLCQLVDPESGMVPNYGANDGALVLPLNSCDYLDFRPVLQAGHYALHHSHLFPPGPWDEDLVWLFGPDAIRDREAGQQNVDGLSSWSAVTGGYYTLRATTSWLMVRCAHYHDRPSHADQLHVDLWWRGQNIACDAGTYLYNGPPPWENGLATTMVHNTVSVDDVDQMSRAGRFLWLDWAQGTVLERQHSTCGLLEYWEGTHTGYTRLPSPVVHCRGIGRIGTEQWLILDALTSLQPHDYRLHWLFPDYAHQWNAQGAHLQLHTGCGLFHIQAGVISNHAQFSLERATPGLRGWRSCYYGQKEPALSLAAIVHDSSVVFWTWFGPTAVTVIAADHELKIHGDGWEVTAQIDLGNGAALLRAVELHGATSAHLRLER